MSLDVVTLRFENPNDTHVVTMRVERPAVLNICRWYASHYAGDPFKVFMDNSHIPLNDAGELDL